MGVEKEIGSNYDRFAGEWTRFMRAGGNYVHRFVEKPAMYRRLPGVRGKDVLCLGCGSGEECAFLRKKGAKRVVGIDISEELLDNAREAYKDIEFYNMSINGLRFGQNSFDLVYSSLAMHYIRDWDSAMRRIYKVMKKGGTFIFSTHHPMIYGGERHLEGGRKHTKIFGYAKRLDGSYRIYGDYFRKRLIRDRWFNGKMTVAYFHQPLESMVGSIVGAGFDIAGIYEPRPPKAMEKYDKATYFIHNRIPQFIVFELRKRE